MAVIFEQKAHYGYFFAFYYFYDMFPIKIFFLCILQFVLQMAIQIIPNAQKTSLLSSTHSSPYHVNAGQFEWNIYITLIKSEMGACVGNKNSLQKTTLGKRPVDVGILQARIVHYFPQDENLRDIKIDDLKMKVWFSNQTFIYQMNQIIDPNRKKPTIKFIVNSQAHQLGRSMNFQIWNNKNLSYSSIPYGIYDLNPIIEQASSSEGSERSSQMTGEVHMNSFDHQAGVIYVDFCYTKMPFDNLKFYIGEVCVVKRKRKEVQKAISYALKIIIGEQIYETPVVSSNKQIIQFNMQTVNFPVPRNLTQGSISVVQKRGNQTSGSADFLVGTSKLKLRELLSYSSLQNIQQKMKTENNINSCSICYVPISDTNVNEIDNLQFLGLPEPTKRIQKKQASKNNITSIKLISEIGDSKNEYQDQKSTRDVDLNQASKIIGTQANKRTFNAIKLSKIPNTRNQQITSSSGQTSMRSKSIAKKQKKRKPSICEPVRMQSMKIGSLPPKNIQDAMLQLAANKKITKNL